MVEERRDEPTEGVEVTESPAVATLPEEDCSLAEALSEAWVAMARRLREQGRQDLAEAAEAVAGWLVVRAQEDPASIG